MDPLVTRSLPGAFWEQVPLWITEWDRTISSKMQLTDEQLQVPWVIRLHYLTENPVGIGLCFFAFLFCYFILNFRVFSLRLKMGHFFKGLLVLALGLGLSDLTGKFLKIKIGRFKPHVDFYNPQAIPALSFPSNHALNTAFFVTLFYFLHTRVFFPQATRTNKQLWFCFFSLYFLGIAYSRIMLGEHYFLDTVFGGLVGFSLATIVHKVVLKRVFRIGSP